MTAWDPARNLSRDDFRHRFLDPDTSDRVVDLLRSAAHGATEAQSHEELKAASADLADAMQRTGLSRWPRFLADATDRATGGTSGKAGWSHAGSRFDLANSRPTVRQDASPTEGRNSAHPTAPVLLRDGQERPVIGGNGRPVLRPAGLDPQFFVQQGIQDKKVIEDLLRDGSEGVGPALLGYLTGRLPKFSRWASWDAQRVGSVYHDEYRDYATIAIGLYAAAAGIPKAVTLEVENIIAVTSRFRKDEEFDNEYTHLPSRNRRNTDIGYKLFDSGNLN